MSVARPPRRLAAVAVAALLASVVGANGVASDDGGPPALELGERPFLVFSPVPPKPVAIASYALPDGAEDYWQLFEPDAPWTSAAEHVDAFAMHAWMLRHIASDEQLRRMFRELRARGIRFGLEMEPLAWPGPEVCDHTESFEGPYDLEQARRIRELGWVIDFVSFDEPYSHAHKLRGPGACAYSVERIVDELGAYVKELRALFPDVVVGSIEPIWRDPRIDARDMGIWLDTYEARTGEPFGFLNIDVDWRREDWPETLLEIEAVAAERGVPFGVLYLGREGESDGRRWLQQAMEHVAAFEGAAGGTPDIVGIYSWAPVPDRVLPDDDLSAHTSMVRRYVGERTAISEPEVTSRRGGRSASVSGVLMDADGAPLAGRAIEAELRSLGGSRQRHTLRGLVPDGASEAVVLVRANVEGGRPSRVDVTIGRITYREADGRNRVPNGSLRRGMEGWGAYGEGRVDIPRRGEPRLRLRAAPRERIFVDGPTFPVTAGAPFELRATIDVPERSVGSGYVAVAFIGGDEVGRSSIAFAPRPVALAGALTGDDGSFELEVGGLEPGRYALDLRYAGDLDEWPAAATTIVELG